MDRFLQCFAYGMMILFCNIGAMENSNMIENNHILQQATLRALSTLSIADNENILHIGSHREEIIRNQNPKAQVYCIDAGTLEMLEEPAQKYDKVLSFACWDVIKKPKETCGNAARLLKKGGQFCVLLPYYKSPYLNAHYSVVTNEKWSSKYNQEKIANIYGSQQIKKYFEAAGLGDNVACAVVRKPFVFDNKNKMIDWIKSCPELLDGIDEKDYEDFINDVLHSYLWKNAVENIDGSIKLYLPYMIMSGYKS